MRSTSFDCISRLSVKKNLTCFLRQFFDFFHQWWFLNHHQCELYLSLSLSDSSYLLINLRERISCSSKWKITLFSLKICTKSSFTFSTSFPFGVSWKDVSEQFFIVLLMLSCGIRAYSANVFSHALSLLHSTFYQVDIGCLSLLFLVSWAIFETVVWFETVTAIHVFVRALVGRIADRTMYSRQ